MDKSKNLYGHLFALTANVMWGLMSPIGKSALQEFSPISVTTFRMVGAAAAFWILSMFCKQEHVNHQDMLKIFFASLFALVFNQGVFIFGLSMTSPIDASIVTTTLPIVTMVVAAIYLKEPITNKKVLGIFIGAMGALILIMSSQAGSNGNGSLIGDLLCLVAQISFSIYLTVFKGLSQRYSAVTINKWMFIYASMCYIPFSYYDISTIRVSLHYDCTEAAPSYGSQYVQLYATDRGYDCSNRDGYRKFRLGERDCYRTCIPGSIYCDSK